MIDRKKLIYALRCSSDTENHTPCIKEKCPYFKKAKEEEINAFLERLDCDRARFPEEFWYGCDNDQICIDAADMLEGKV